MAGRFSRGVAVWRLLAAVVGAIVVGIGRRQLDRRAANQHDDRTLRIPEVRGARIVRLLNHCVPFRFPCTHSSAGMPDA